MTILDAHARHRLLAILTEGMDGMPDAELAAVYRQGIADEIDRFAERLFLQGLAHWRRPADGIGEARGTA